MTDLKSALMELTDRLCPKGEQPLKRGAAIVETAKLIIELEPPLCSDCGDNHGGATGCFPSSSEDTNSQVSIHSEKDGNKHSGEEMRQQLHEFAMNYKAESAESRKECIDKVMEPIEEMQKEKEARDKKLNKVMERLEEEIEERQKLHKEIETLKIQTEIAQEQSTGWMKKNEKVKRDCCVMWEALGIIKNDCSDPDCKCQSRRAREALSSVANYLPKA